MWSASDLFLGYVTLLLLRILSLRHVKTVYRRAGATPARRWVNMNEFLRSCTYVNKNRGVVGKDPLWCYIKIFPQILKVVITNPYKRLRKKWNQILMVRFRPKQYCFNFTDFALFKSFAYVNIVSCLLYQKYKFHVKKKNSEYLTNLSFWEYWNRKHKRIFFFFLLFFLFGELL